MLDQKKDSPSSRSVRDHFEALVDLPESERRDYLEALKCSDEALSRDVEELLAHHLAESSTLDRISDDVVKPILQAREDSESPLCEKNKWIGRQVSHFKIERYLGRGGMGVVYEAKDLSLNRQVALKFLPSEATGVAKERFLREARAASALDHPNIANVHEVGETDEGQIFIAMSLYDGETLEHKLERGAIRFKDVIEYSIQLAEGLSRAHREGISHRDVKPSNIMITEEGVVKLLDFGIAKLTCETAITRPGMVLGSGLYMSPEQARGEVAGESSDIWSLGAVMYEMACGQRPFSGDHLEAVASAILGSEPKSLSKVAPSVPMEFSQVVMRCLKKIPEERYASIDSVLTDLRQLRKSRLNYPLGKLKQRRTNWLNKSVVTTFMAIFCLYLTYKYIGGWGEVPEKIETIAVFPFEVISGEEEFGYFGVGMQNGLIAQLSEVPGLTVICREAVQPFVASVVDLEPLKRKLGVDGFVTGSAQFGEERVLVTVQLVDARSGQSRWGASYDRELSVVQLLGVQNEISSSVASAIELTLKPEEREEGEVLPTRNLAALEAYYKAMETESDRAKELLGEALELDPGFVDAHRYLAELYLSEVWSKGLSSEMQCRKAQPHVRKVQELEPESSATYAMLGSFYSVGQQYAKAEDVLKIAVETNPNDWRSLNALGNLYQYHIPKYNEAVELFKKSLRINPGNIWSKQCLADNLILAGRYDEGHPVLEEVLEEVPDYGPALATLGEVEVFRNYRFDRSVFYQRKAIESGRMVPRSFELLGNTYRNMGEEEAATYCLEESLRVAPDSDDACVIRGILHEIRGEDELALACFRQSQPENFWSGYASMRIRMAEFEKLTAEEAIRRILSDWPELESGNVELHNFNVGRVVQFLRYMSEAGRLKELAGLRDEVQAFFHQKPRLGVQGYQTTDITFYYALEDRPRAIAALRSWVYGGGCGTLKFFDYDCEVEEWLSEDPEYEELMARSEARLAWQRENLKRLEKEEGLLPLRSLKL